MTERSSLADAMAGEPGRSPFVQATLTDYDPATKLSTVKILGGEISNVPKLDHVQFGGEWELISSGSGVGDVSFNVPARDYKQIDVHAQGFMDSNPASLGIAVNKGHITSNVHRYMRRFRQGDNSGGTAQTSGADAFNLGVWNHAHTCHVLIKFVHVTTSEVIEWQIQSWLSNNATGASAAELAWLGGAIDDASVDIEDLTLQSAGTIDEIVWDAWGRTPAKTSGLQLLCIRDESIPLTIVGVRGGATI